MSPKTVSTVPFPAPHCPLSAPPRRLTMERRMASGGARGATGRDRSRPAVVAASAASGPCLHIGSAVRGRPSRDLGVLKAPHFQELHLEVLLAERRVVEGVAVLRAPPEQVGVEGQSLASTSTCKNKQGGWDLLSPPSLPKRDAGPADEVSRDCAHLAAFCPLATAQSRAGATLSCLLGRSGCQRGGRAPGELSAGRPPQKVALAAPAELLSCLESWRTRKAACVPAARFALIPLPRAGGEAEAVLRVFLTRCAPLPNPPGSGGAQRLNPRAQARPGRWQCRQAAGVSAPGDRARPFLGLIPTCISSPSRTKRREGLGKDTAAPRGQTSPGGLGSGAPPLLAEPLWGSQKEHLCPCAALHSPADLRKRGMTSSPLISSSYPKPRGVCLYRQLRVELWSRVLFSQSSGVSVGGCPPFGNYR